MSVVRLSLRGRLALLGIVVPAVLALILAYSPAVYAQVTIAQWCSIAFLLALYLLADANAIPWYLSNGRISIVVSTGIDIALVLVFGPAVAIPFVALAVLVTETYVRRELVKLIFNVANQILSTAAASLVFVTFGVVGESPLASGMQVLAWLLAAGTYVLVNSTLLAVMISAANGVSFPQLWRTLITGAEMQQWSQPPLGALIAVLQLHSPWALVLAVLPLAALYVSYRRYLQLNEQTRAVIETLADTVDKRDPITSQHSRRVTERVQEILRALGSVPLTEVETIIGAARIHDLGKIGVSDACLHKAGPLDETEWREMAQHPVIGAQLLKPLSMYQEGLAIVRHHHERWDGRGYPDGLAGTQIPFGARVLAVADAFDAMTSNRLYQRAMSPEHALAEIQSKSGSQFDPVVVQAFIRAMRTQVMLVRPNAVSAEA